MITLGLNQVQLKASPANKLEAIRAVGNLLVQSGCIQPGYIESMFGREQVANTYLGNGITIPHGLPKDRELINRTGIAILQVPAGVRWNNAEVAYLVVGIAAKTDEHIEVLRRLTRVLGNPDQVKQLVQTGNPADIIEALTGERPVPAAPTIPDYSLSIEVVVPNKTGLHARPATNFIALARRFQSSIRVRHGDMVVDGKSMISLLQLGVESSAKIRISADGPDAQAALEALQAAIAEGLGDEPEEAPAPTLSGGFDWAPKNASSMIEGVSAAGGLAIGIIRQHASQEIVVEDSSGSPMEQGEKFQTALTNANQELDKLYEEVKVRFGSGKASIFRAHAEFLNDSLLIQQTVSLIFSGHSAAWAWQEVIRERVNQIQKLDDSVLASRAVDLSDVGQRILRHLTGNADMVFDTHSRPAILAAADLKPSDTASLDPDAILGFCTSVGGPTSHTAIIARSMGIPAVVAAGKTVLDIPNGTPCILDGFNGRLYLNPSEADLRDAADMQRQLKAREEEARTSRFLAAQTSDGHRLEIAANINRAADVAAALDAGAEGVGLMRTEFLFLERESLPTESEQFEAYKAMVQALAGRPLIIRTLDIGGDKDVPYLNLPKEDNSFLGIRGVRLCLARPDLFIPQLRAIYRAAAYGPLKIMFPMISTLEDFTQARDMAEAVRKELNAPQVELGIMIEVPSAAILADQFAKIVDFFSIGTNDLTQYTLAMDRVHPQLAKQADGLHPSVLRMVKLTVDAAVRENKWVGVCGGVASDPKGSLLLAGLGVSELSVSAPNIPSIKAQFRKMSFTEMQEMAQKALTCRNAAEVRAL